jgi:outer membrane biosynthesis protein TonB
LITGLLLLVAISGAALAYYFLRHRTTDSASNAPSVSNSNQPAESSNTNSPAGETSVNAAGPQQEEKPPAQETLRAEDGTPQQASQPTPKPSASVELTREARARQERSERATDAPAPANSPTPLPAPTGSPVAQATPGQTPAPSPAANSNNSGTPPSQANSDAFYFQAVNVLNGRDPRALKRAELLRALQYFQNVKSGPHVEEARRQAQRLGRELDRQNKQSQR